MDIATIRQQALLSARPKLLNILPPHLQVLTNLKDEYNGVCYKAVYRIKGTQNYIELTINNVVNKLDHVYFKVG